MEGSNIPDYVSYNMLLNVLFKRTIADYSADELNYHIGLTMELQNRKDRVETEAWWYRYYR